MLIQAMNSFQVAKRLHKENVKAQYTDKKGFSGAKEYFRASELGSADRKIIYGFFGHQLPKSEKSALNLRQLENGDFVHDRYQSAWEEMGVLISMEERLSSFTDEYLKQFAWEWAGHYDGLLDMNILRAHAEGRVTVNSVFNEEKGIYEMEVMLEEAFEKEIGIYNEAGEFAEDYNPPLLLADIKTMNPWGFDDIKKKGDLTKIAGYIDQISFYMYMKNTPYGSIFVENKANNDTVEVQVVWSDFHDGIEYKFDNAIHGEQTSSQVRMVIDSGRFFGDATREGCVPRLQRLWLVKEELKAAEAAGDPLAVQEIFARAIPRCAPKADAFPCSWGHKNNDVQTCEYFNHCWSSKHNGQAVAEWAAAPPEAIWEFEDEGGAVVQIDNRKVPAGVNEESFLALVIAGMLDYKKFVIEEGDNEPEISIEEASERALNGDSHLFSANGEMIFDAPMAPEGAADIASEVEEYINDHGLRAIKCANCRREVTYQKLGAGDKKKCTFCKHTNSVIKA